MIDLMLGEIYSRGRPSNPTTYCESSSRRVKVKAS